MVPLLPTGLGGLRVWVDPADADLVELPGTNAIFSALALGVAGVRYQWQYAGVNLPGRTNATLVLSGISTNDEGGYRVVYSTGAGPVTSRVATLTVIRPPVITHVSPTVPSTNWLVAGESDHDFSMELQAQADGACRYPLRYQWFTNGVALAGVTNATLNIDQRTLPWVSIYETNPADMEYSVKVWNPVGTNQAGPWTVRVISTNRWGAVLGWGDNGEGQVRGPVGLTNVLAISTGRYHSVAVSEDGGLVYWGYSWTDLPGTLTNLVSAAAGYAHTLGLRRDGSVISWGSWGSEANWVPSNLSDVKAIAAGQYHNLALLGNSTVTAWGANHAELGWHLTEVPAGLTNVTAVAAGYYHSLALKTDGTVVSWGYNDAGQTNVPAGLSNVVGIAAGERFSLALKSDGTVTAWGANGAGQCSVPAGLGNVMAVAAGGDHSAALKTDGTVVCWGSGSRGQLDIPAQVTNITMIAAGGDHTLAGVFSPLVEYPVDVTKDLLLIYNSTSTNSIVVKDYYLAHRPLVGGANELGISCPTNELISSATFTNQIRPAYLNWLTNHPTRHPLYVILFPDMPTRMWGDVTSDRTISNSVAFEIHTAAAGIQPFVTSINMGLDSMGPASLTNDCIGYINKLAAFGTNGSLFISASAGGYANTNYVLDDVGYEGYAPNILVSGAKAALISAGTLADAVQIMETPEPCARFVTNALNEIGCAEYSAMPHLTNATGVAGYICWGAHSTLANEYARNGVVAWAGDSGWWIIETIESFNGWRDTGQGNFTQWFCPYAFGGTSYSNTPVGAVTHTDEPNLQGVNRSEVYFALWQRGFCFARCAWISRGHSRFQAVGDPFVRR